MTRIDTVLLKVASRCNLDCSYCYVYHMGDDSWKSQPKLISARIQTAVAERLSELCRDQEEPFSVVLHGGEPLMLGTARLESLLRDLRAVLSPKCEIHVQTNGVLLSDAMIEALVRYRVGISISLDGPADVHDGFRKDHRRRGSYSRVVDAVRRLTAHQGGRALFSGVLAVVDPQTDPEAVYSALKQTGAPSIDFLYRDGNRSKLPYGKHAIETTEYGSWMCRILDLYLSDQNPPVIRILDDTIRLLLGGRGRKEGIGITDYGILVVDTDGSIQKNDTLKSAYSTADKFKVQWSVLHNSLSSVVNDIEFANYHVSQRPSSTICRSCSLLQVCGGGMPAHRWSDEGGFDNPTVFCSDQKLLIAHMLEWVTRHERSTA